VTGVLSNGPPEGGDLIGCSALSWTLTRHRTLTSAVAQIRRKLCLIFTGVPNAIQIPTPSRPAGQR
ncbi:Asperfuranone polyketide synthase afoG, partial [Dissostichus eleginoides]